MQAGLSFDQAPPIMVPFRFFLSAPLFAFVAAMLLLWQGPQLLVSRWMPASLATTHLLTLGFLAMTMMGAMMQLLPVVAGAPVARAVGVARTVHGLLLLGIVALAAGFLYAAPLAIRAAFFLLGGALAVFLIATAFSLRRAVSNPTASAMRFALLALLIASGLGLTLASNHGWTWWLQERARVADLHLVWGLVGWVGLLVTGVAYQVVPMFQVTPAYPKRLTRTLAPAMFALLVLWSAAAGWLPDGTLATPAILVGLCIAAGFGLFAVMTLRLQSLRKRKVTDVTLNFWRFGMVCLLLAVASWGVLMLLDTKESNALLPLLLFTVGFAVSVVNGMLYKIVPFLIWFHLQSQATNITMVPNMKEIIPARRMRVQMWLHFAATTLLVLALGLPLLVYPAGALLGLSMLLLEANLLAAYAVYQRHSREMGSLRASG